MENLQHIKARIEREIEEVMGEKKWTPRHAEVIEELLSCEKCIKEIVSSLNCTFKYSL